MGNRLIRNGSGCLPSYLLNDLGVQAEGGKR